MPVTWADAMESIMLYVDKVNVGSDGRDKSGDAQ